MNHGHDFDEASGDIIIFNNRTSGTAHVLKLGITEASSTLSINLVKDYTGPSASSVLGAVQRLPSGNTLVTYSTAGVIAELDPA